MSLTRAFYDKTFRQEVANAVAKISQFNIAPLDAIALDGSSRVADIDALTSRGVWGLQNPQPYLQALGEDAPFNITIGFRPSSFHLGHLTLMNELHYLLQKGGRAHFVIASHEAGESIDQHQAEIIAADFWAYMNKAAKHRGEGTHASSFSVHIDELTPDFIVLEKEIQDVIKFGKLKQLYGWGDDLSLSQARNATTMAACLLFMAYKNPELPSVVTVDHNQVTHCELAKITAKKLGIGLPTFSYRALLPSLMHPPHVQNADNRMSAKNQKSRVMLSATRDEAIRTFQKSATAGGMTPADHAVSGGTPSLCPFFRAASQLLPEPAIENAVFACTTGKALCGACKKDTLEKIKPFFA